MIQNPNLQPISTQVTPGEVRRALEQIRVYFNALQQNGGVVAARDLAAGELVVVGAGGSSLPEGEAAAIPPAPTGFVVSGAFGSIILEWDQPTFAGYAYTEIWRAAVNDVGQAVLVGTTQASVFSDTPPNSAIAEIYFYWVRFVNTDGVPGPYNAASGTGGSTASDPAYVRDLLLSQFGYEDGIFPVRSVDALPSLPDSLYPGDCAVFLKPDGPLYWNVAGEWTAKINAEFIDGQITSTQITDGAISTPKLSAGAVNADKLAANSIIAGKIAAGAIIAGDAVIANAAISTAHLIDAIITNAKIKNLAVDNAKIADATITGGKLANLTIEDSHIKRGTITGAAILDGTITGAEIANATIVGNNILSGTITGGHMAPSTIETTNIKTGNITTETINGNAVTEIYSSFLASQGITTGWATEVQIAAGSVNSVAGSKVMVQFGYSNCISVDYSAQVGIKIYRNGIHVATFTAWADADGGHNPRAISYTDVPGSGAISYVVKAYDISHSLGWLMFYEISLALLTAKR